MNDSDSEADPLAQLAEEFAERYRRGERPSLAEYTERYPEHAERIRHLFPALVEMEQLGSVGGPVDGDLAGIAAGRRGRSRRSSANTASSARWRAAAWASSTRRCRSRSAGTWR